MWVASRKVSLKLKQIKLMLLIVLRHFSEIEILATTCYGQFNTNEKHTHRITKFGYETSICYLLIPCKKFLVDMPNFFK